MDRARPLYRDPHRLGDLPAHAIQLKRQVVNFDKCARGQGDRISEQLVIETVVIRQHDHVDGSPSVPGGRDFSMAPS